MGNGIPMTRSSRAAGLSLGEPQDPRRITGTKGERAAEHFLRRAGMKIVARGFRFRGGEIDLIAREGEELVFVEVKTRTSRTFGSPQESVTSLKRRKIVRAASAYLQSAGAWEHPCRFDVISVHLGNDGEVELEHLRDAFSADR